MGEWTEDKKRVKSLSIDLQKEKMTVEVKDRRGFLSRLVFQIQTHSSKSRFQVRRKELIS